MVGMGCRSQIIKSLYDEAKEVEGAYYKDIYDDLNNFVGTWEYTNGTTSLTITLLKKEMQHRTYTYKSFSYYQDVLIGGYKYMENGVEKINTLSQLSLSLPNDSDYYIFGNILLPPATTNCSGCLANMRMVHCPTFL